MSNAICRYKKVCDGVLRRRSVQIYEPAVNPIVATSASDAIRVEALSTLSHTATTARNSTVARTRRPM